MAFRERYFRLERPGIEFVSEKCRSWLVLLTNGSCPMPPGGGSNAQGPAWAARATPPLNPAAATTTQIAAIMNILRRAQGVRCQNRCEFGAAGQLVGGVQPGGGVQLSGGVGQPGGGVHAQLSGLPGMHSV